MPSFSPVSIRRQLAATLVADLERGRWKGSLPGLRQMANLYRVNRRTCSAALDLAEKEGWLAPSRPRSRRRILGKPSGGSAAQPPGQILVLADNSERHNNMHLLLVNRAMAMWGERGGDVRQVEADFSRRCSPAKLIRDYFSGARVDCVLAIQAPRPWAEALDAAGPPVFMYGGTMPPAARNITLVGTPLTALLGETLEYLRRMGHRRILLPCHRPFRELRKKCMELFCAAYPDATPEEAAQWIPAADLLDGRDWAALWARALPRLKPTCVIVWSSLEALSLVSYCARAGIRVPRDLSVVALDGSELMDWFERPLTHVQTDDDAAWTIFRKWVEKGFRPKGFLGTASRFLEGSTVENLLRNPARAALNAGALCAPDEKRFRDSPVNRPFS